MPTAAETLAACPVVVLAAGRGTRMGGPKAHLDVAGQPWWMIQQEKLKRLGLRAIWVIVPGDWNTMPDGRWIARQPGEPMFESIRAGVADLAASEARGGLSPAGVFVLPVDVPVAARSVWMKLADTLATAGPHSSPIAPVYRGNSGHPLLVPWAWAMKWIVSAPAGARLDHLCKDSMSTVEVLDPGVTTNLNTPADVAGWIAANPRG